MVCQLKKNVILNNELFKAYNYLFILTSMRTIITQLNRYWDGFLHLLFPSTCLCCDSELHQSENSCCSICFGELPFTHFEKMEESTPLDELFYGRVRLTNTFSLMYYEKTSSVKEILHAIKYKNRPDVAIEFGEMIGKRLRDKDRFSSIDLIIPVPLHQKKKYIRGYNQSEAISKGIQKFIQAPIATNIIHKHEHTKSQTKLGKFGRWDNVSNQFHVDEKIQQYSHIAIVDDVITTGATLESIIQSILLISPQIQISVISLALAK